MTAIPKLQAYALPESHDIPQNRVDWAFEPQRAALLIHDMRDYSASFQGENCPTIEQVITSIVTLCDCYKQHNTPVYHTAQPKEQSGEDRALLNDMRGPGLTRSLGQQKAVDHLTSDTDGTVLVKWRCSALHRSPLEQILKEGGHSQLITAEVYTHIDYMTTAADAFMRDIRPFMMTDVLVGFNRNGHLMSLEYMVGRSGRVVTTEGLSSVPIPTNKVELREVILPLLDESDKPFDDDNLIDYGLDLVRMMALTACWRKTHGDIDSVVLARSSIIDAWWKLFSREVK